MRPLILATAAFLVGCVVSLRQRARLRKRFPCRGKPTDKDDCGARAEVLEGPAGLDFYVRRWDPSDSSDINCVVVMTHGMLVHSGVFSEAAKLLNAHGIAAVSYDLYGHGLSGSYGGIQGLHTSFEDWITQGLQVIDICKTEWYPGLPVFLYSESYGGIINLTMCGRHHQLQSQIAGLIVSSAPLKLPPEMTAPPAIVAVFKFLAACFPLLPVPDPKATDKAHFASAFGDEGWASKIWNDPLVVKSMKLASVPVILESFTVVKQVVGKIRKTPMLVMHGKNDTRCLFQGSMELFDRIGGHHKVLKLYENMYHQLLHGTDADVKVVTDDMIQWMQHLR